MLNFTESHVLRAFWKGPSSSRGVCHTDLAHVEFQPELSGDFMGSYPGGLEHDRGSQAWEVWKFVKAGEYRSRTKRQAGPFHQNGAS